MAADTDLARIATALYAAPLGEFVSARASRAKSVSDRGLAAEISALRKPSIAAWVVNVFAQERTEELGEALRLARELREAQEDLDAPALARLGRERRALTRRLAEQARDLAIARGEKVTAGTLEAVHQTISAAFFDETASIAVASGRLVRDLEPSESVVLDDVVAGAASHSEEPGSEPGVDELAQRRRKRQAERAVRDAEAAVTAAKHEQAAAASANREADHRVDAAVARVADLERELARTGAELEDARRVVGEAQARLARASDAVQVASDTLERTRQDLNSV